MSRPLLQILLLEEVWAELFMLNAIQWSLPMPPAPLLAHDADPHASKFHHLTELNSHFKALDVDLAEYAYLKAIVLFRQGD